jgi:Carbohydrate binding module (family 6)/PA14 domain
MRFSKVYFVSLTGQHPRSAGFGLNLLIGFIVCLVVWPTQYVWSFPMDGPGVFGPDSITAIDGSVIRCQALSKQGNKLGEKKTKRARIEAMESRILLAGDGLSAHYFQGIDFDGISSTAIASTIDFNWGNDSAPSGLDPATRTFSAQWTGQIDPQFSETYTFLTQAAGGVQLKVNGQLLINRWADVPDGLSDANGDSVSNSLDLNVLATNYGLHLSDGTSEGDFNHDGVVNISDFNILANEFGESFEAQDSGSISLQAGKTYNIELDYLQTTGPAAIKLLWDSQSQPLETVPQTQLFSENVPLATDRIEAESFDNAKTASVNVQPANDIDGGYCVAQAQAGDWLDFNVNVPSTGLYDLNMRVASPGQGGSLHVNVDGANVSNTIWIPDTGGGQQWTTVTRHGINLTAGIHTVRVALDSVGDSGSTGSLNWFTFQPTTNPVATPGSGFTDVTPVPAAINPTALYGDAKAIARWDVVPNETFDNDMNIGVVAFHAAGIDRVDFSVNGGNWVSVRTMTNNPQVNVNEYWTSIRASDFADGAVEVRAIVYPKAGIPMVLQGATMAATGEQSLALYANSNHSLASQVLHVRPSTGSDSNPGTADAPFATLKQALRAATDGSTIIVDEAGRYDIDRSTEAGQLANKRWVTIEPAAGLPVYSVVIIGTVPGRDRLVPRINYLKFESVAFDWSTYTYISSTLWYDHCEFYDPNGVGAIYTGQTGTPFRSSNYVTSSTAHDMAYGFASCALVRDCTVSQVLDAFQNSLCVINSNVTSMDVTQWAQQHHPDIFQYFGETQDVIVYGVTGQNVNGAQVFFLGQPVTAGNDMRNCAFVNVSVQTVLSKTPMSQLQGSLTHVIFSGINLPNQQFLFRTDATGLNHFTGTYVIFIDSILEDSTVQKYITNPTDGVTFLDVQAAT